MSSDWLEYSIDEIKASENSSIAIGPFGSRMKSDCYTTSGVRVVRGTNLMGSREFSGEFVFISTEKAKELGGANLAPFDLVFPHRGSIGEVGIVPSDGENYVISSSLMKLKCDTTKALPEFVYYFFKSDIGRYELLKNSSQVGTPGIGQPLTSLKSIRLKLPGLKEQKSISKLLMAIDDRIALLRETNGTLEAIAQALFKSWFVDFDPVHANAGTQAPSLPPEIQALFPATFTDSPQGPIPEGWSVKACQEIIDVRDGTHASPKPSETGYPLVTSRHITSGELSLDGTYLISEAEFLDISKRSKVDHLDVLLTMIGTVGIPALVLSESTNFAIKNIGLFKTSKRPDFSAYIYLLLKSKEMQNYLHARMAGTTQKYLSLKALREIAIIEPTPEIIQAFSVNIRPIFEGIQNNRVQVQALTDLRDTLLPRLISGQLRLPEEEQAVAAITGYANV
jgi:type I restriction enzyme S subunit